jgi:hypothetical protein
VDSAHGMMVPTTFLRRSFHYYLWLYGFVGNGASACHI